MADVRYRVELADPGAHLFRVEMTILSPDPSGQELSMPAWIPGSYMIRDFAKNIVSISAYTESGPVELVKLNKHSWRAESTRSSPLSVVYEVYAWDLSVRAAHFDTTHAYFNGTSLFLSAKGHEHGECAVEMTDPGTQWARDWKVATTLDYVGEQASGFGDYRAADYAELIDHPVEIGRCDEIDFSVDGVPHQMAIYGRHYTDRTRLAKDLEKVCATHADLFGGLPVKRYLFLVMALGEGYGGLEHRSSTSLLCHRDDLPGINEDLVGKKYTRFLGLCSHEYFHLWNVKRIRPSIFMDSALDAEVNTELLWVFEGFTSYYDDLALIRSGCIEPKAYLQLLAEVITRVYRGTGRFKQSVAQSSFDTWTKFYKQDENAPNAIVSYYAKGALVALTLDMLLRQRTADRCNLDHIMRALWTRYGEVEKGVPERAVEVLVNELSGIDFSEFFATAVYGTADLPLAECLDAVGIEIRFRVSKGKDDSGEAVDEWSEIPQGRSLGLRLEAQGEPKVTHVFDGGAAQQAGIAPGDILLALDGLRITTDNLKGLLQRVPDAKDVEVVLFRRDELMRFMVRPKPAMADTCELRFALSPDDEQLARRRNWLRLAG